MSLVASARVQASVAQILLWNSELADSRPRRPPGLLLGGPFAYHASRASLFARRECGPFRLCDRRRRHDGGRGRPRHPEAATPRAPSASSAPSRTRPTTGRRSPRVCGRATPPDSIWRKTDEAGAELHPRPPGRDAGSGREAGHRRSRHDARLRHAPAGHRRHTAPTSRTHPTGVIYFRTLDDYRRTRELADRGARFVVIGGGFIGSEIAAALRMQGRDVTMIVKDDGIGARVFPADLSRWLVEYYREKGVTVRLGKSGRTGSKSRDGKFRVRRGKDEPLAADAVVAGLGIEPNVDLARAGRAGGGRRHRGGRAAPHQPAARSTLPATWRTSSIRRWASASAWSTRTTPTPWARSPGRNMAGAGRRYDHLPFFYSDLFDLGYEAVGDVSARHQTVADWKEEFREGVVYYLEGGRVRGVLLWNIWGQVDAARALIAEPGPFRPSSSKGRLPAGHDGLLGSSVIAGLVTQHRLTRGRPRPIRRHPHLLQPARHRLQVQLRAAQPGHLLPLGRRSGRREPQGRVLPLRHRRPAATGTRRT